jgi:hypothetical protein
MGHVQISARVRNSKSKSKIQNLPGARNSVENRQDRRSPATLQKDQNRPKMRRHDGNRKLDPSIADRFLVCNGFQSSVCEFGNLGSSNPTNQLANVVIRFQVISPETDVTSGDFGKYLAAAIFSRIHSSATACRRVVLLGTHGNPE